MTGMLQHDVRELLDAGLSGDGPIVALTGAGISAESGIPTFRGPEGYWKIGSKNYQPEELATWSTFSKMPDEVWAWYLYRRGVCRAAEPNDAHAALARLEAELGDRFLLVTQNVDGLHLRAGNSLDRTYQIHGNIQQMRCAADCCPDISPVPEAISTDWPKGRKLGDEERARLVCDKCGGRSRPHVLWFDECYDEAHFRFESSLAAAASAALLIVIGTSGATNLPSHVAQIVASRGAPFLAVNLDPSPLTAMAEHSDNGLFVEGTACAKVPAMVDHLLGG